RGAGERLRARRRAGSQGVPRRRERRPRADRRRGYEGPEPPRQLMFGIGTGELLLLLVIALIVLGPERMPKVARDLGRMVGDLRRTSDELREEFLNADKLIDAAAKQATPLGSGAEPPAAGRSEEHTSELQSR